MSNTIEIITGTSENACSCTTCQNMCRKTPCLGTPQDILTLVNNGHKDKLKGTIWGAGWSFGIGSIEMVQPHYDKDRGACAFLSEDNLCTLHDAGIKPTEGKLATCKPHGVDAFEKTLAYQVAATWKDPANKSIINKIEKAVL